MKRQPPSQTLEEQFLSPDTRQAPLAETIRLGAQLMLQKAVELEVTEFLGRDHYQRRGDGLLQGYRNGYADKRVETGEGPLHLKMPQVRNTIDAFKSVWLQSLVRRSDKLAALIPQLYVKGMSTRDIEAGLTDAVEVEGVSKSTVCWRSFFEDMKQRGLTDPLLTVIDGNSGLRKAVRECFPDSWVQRCQVHRMRNILCKLPEKARPALKKLIRKAFTAQSYNLGLEQAQGVVARYQEQFPEAMKCLATDLAECLTALRFPEPTGSGFGRPTFWSGCLVKGSAGRR